MNYQYLPPEKPLRFVLKSRQLGRDTQYDPGGMVEALKRYNDAIDKMSADLGALRKPKIPLTDPRHPCHGHLHQHQ